MNRDLISVLERVITHKESQRAAEKDPKERSKIGFSISSIKKVIGPLAAYTKKLKSGQEAVDNIPGVGKGIATRIDEFIETGTLSELPVEIDESLVQSLITVPGIGYSHAQRLIEKYDLKSLDDLRNRYLRGEISVGKNQLTHQQGLGLKYYADLQERIPRTEMEGIEGYLLKTLNPIRGLKVSVCGSYRRGCKDSGDVDVLISHAKMSGQEALDVVIATLDGFLIDHLTKNHDAKYMGVCRHLKKARHIDIRFIRPESWAAAQLYFTGPAELNIRMRNVAIKKKLLLNEYGLYQGEDQLPTPTEESIFQALGLNYLAPTER